MPQARVQSLVRGGDLFKLIALPPLRIAEIALGLWQGSYKAIKYTKDAAMLDAFNDRYQVRWHEKSGATNEARRAD